MWKRDESVGTSPASSETTNLAISLTALILFATVLASTMFFLRRSRKSNVDVTQPSAFQDLEKGHGITIQTTDIHGHSSYVVLPKCGKPMLSNPDSPPHSPDNVPEIRITFPDETDDNGRTESGRVLVVRVGETTIGMEPIESLPAYEKESKSPFYSIDLKEERV